MFKTSLFLILLCAAAASGHSSAADMEHGKYVAKKVCGPCHGSEGVSRAPVIPNLSGQKEAYILKQLEAFKSGARSSSSMKGIVVNLDEKDFTDVAAYFSAHGTVEDTTAKVKTKTLEKAKDKLTLCAPCHGSNGIGIAPQFPNLAGQKDRYLLKQLEKFQEGRRKDESMAPIAAQLSEADIKALAKYFSKVGKVKINK